MISPDHQIDATGHILLNAGPSEAGAHRQELFRMCEQKFFARLFAKLALEIAVANEADRVEEAPEAESEKKHLVIGSLVHIGLAHLYARIMQWQNAQDIELYYAPETAVEMLADQNPTWWTHVGISVDILRAYQAFWPNDHTRFRIVAVEQVIRAHVGADDPRVREICGPEGFIYTQRMDLALEDVARRVYIWDHKGMGHMRGKEERTFALSGQFLGYQTLGHLVWPGRFGGVLANIFERKAEKPRFKRVPPLSAPFALQCFKQNLIETELDIRRKMAEPPRDPWHYRKAFSEQVCKTIYGECEHWEKCRQG